MLTWILLITRWVYFHIKDILHVDLCYHARPPTQGAKKLERALMSIRELQNSLRDGVILFRALLEELRRNMDEERQGIVMSYELLHDAIKQTYDSLLTSLDSQYNTTDRFETNDYPHLKMMSRILIITMTVKIWLLITMITMLLSDSCAPSSILWARCCQQ